MKKWSIWLSVLLLTGCAGVQRSCSSWQATTFGADWMVVQYNAFGDPMNCWTLTNTSVANEDKSDGVHWLDAQRGHLVHIAGWYNWVQVNNGDFGSAAKTLGIDATRCHEGSYQAGS